MVDFVDEIRHEIGADIINAPVQMEYEIIDEDNNDPNVPDFYFSESFSSSSVQSDGHTTTNYVSESGDYEDGEPEFME